MIGADVIPVSVLTGFLGSGKTTMLGHLLRQPEFSRTAVIINEFGQIGLDHELVETSEDSIVALHHRMPVLHNPHRSVANASRPAAPARRGLVLPVRSDRDRNQRACRSGADPPRADDGPNFCGSPRAWQRGDDGRCGERLRHPRTRTGVTKASCGRRPYRCEQA